MPPAMRRCPRARRSGDCHPGARGELSEPRDGDYPSAVDGIGGWTLGDCLLGLSILGEEKTLQVEGAGLVFGTVTLGDDVGNQIFDSRPVVAVRPRAVVEPQGKAVVCSRPERTARVLGSAHEPRDRTSCSSAAGRRENTLAISRSGRDRSVSRSKLLSCAWACSRIRSMEATRRWAAHDRLRGATPACHCGSSPSHDRRLNHCDGRVNACTGQTFSYTDDPAPKPSAWPPIARGSTHQTVPCPREAACGNITVAGEERTNGR